MEEFIDCESTVLEAETGATVLEAETDENDALPYADDTEAETESISEEEPNSDSGDRVRELECEIERLNALLCEKEQEQSKILSELGEFSRLFPNVAVKDVPESVWKKVENGLPLYAAYAIHEREEILMRQRADEVNTHNALFSAGRAGDAGNGEYFSPEEVRTMTQKEVHENYSKIRTSMKYWR